MTLDRRCLLRCDPPDNGVERQLGVADNILRTHRPRAQARTIKGPGSTARGRDRTHCGVQPAPHPAGRSRPAPIADPSTVRTLRGPSRVSRGRPLPPCASPWPWVMRGGAAVSDPDGSQALLREMRSECGRTSATCPPPACAATVSHSLRAARRHTAGPVLQHRPSEGSPRLGSNRKG